MTSIARLGLPVLLVALLTACSVPEPTASPLPQPPSPLQASPLSTSGSPSSPIPFRLNKPIVEGVSEVSGTGPPGALIIIADITFMGDVLGSGAIKPDGTFTIGVPVLEKNHWIGILVTDMSATPWNMDDITKPEFFGDEASQAPQVGFFHDTTTVQAR